MGTKNCLDCGAQNKIENKKCEKCGGELQDTKRSTALLVYILIPMIALFIIGIIIVIISAIIGTNPVLNNIKSPVHTEKINIGGKDAEAGAKVKLSINDEEIAEVIAQNNGKFIFSDVTLNEGENKIKVTATKDNKTKTSNEIKVVYEKSKVTATPTPTPATPTPTPTPQTPELDAEVRFSSTAFMIKNNETQNWTSCEFVINGKLFGSDYTYKTTAGISANDSIIVPMSEFTKGDGTRFDPYSIKAKNLFIACEVEGNHRTGYYAISE